MYKHAEKLEHYFQSKVWWLRLYYYKLYQLFYQLLLVIVIGAVSINSGRSCSVPIQVFLSGLFYMYIFAAILNFAILSVRYTKTHCLGSLKLKRLSNRLDFCYFPLYLGFSILEFIWYILGAEWISESNNCSEVYPDGLRLSQALVVLWVLTMFVILLSFISINIFLCCRSYSGAQSLGPEIVINSNIPDYRSYPEEPKIILKTVSHTPNRLPDD